MAESAFAWRHVATHEMGSRRLIVSRDDARGATELQGLNKSGWGERVGKTYYYLDAPESSAPEGPFHTEQALAEALNARVAEALQPTLFSEVPPCASPSYCPPRVASATCTPPAPPPSSASCRQN